MPERILRLNSARLLLSEHELILSHCSLSAEYPERWKQPIQEPGSPISQGQENYEARR